MKSFREAILHLDWNFRETGEALSRFQVIATRLGLVPGARPHHHPHGFTVVVPSTSSRTSDRLHVAPVAGTRVLFCFVTLALANPAQPHPLALHPVLRTQTQTIGTQHAFAQNLIPSSIRTSFISSSDRDISTRLFCLCSL